jgi:quinoprotein glucose dehydrogenase
MVGRRCAPRLSPARGWFSRALRWNFNRAGSLVVKPPERDMPGVLSVVVLVLGAYLAVGGGWLVLLGGSWYYLLAGAGLLGTGALLLMHGPLALVLYAVVVAASLAWAIYEVRLDWWQLAPRGSLIGVIGLLLLLPSKTRYLDPAGTRRWKAVWSGAALPLAAMLALSLGVAGYAMMTTPHAISGVLADQMVGRTLTESETRVPSGEWPAYGRTEGGSHYSPLSAITTDNVMNLRKVWQYHTGDVRSPADTVETTYEVTPTMIGDTLYRCTPHHIAIALDPRTGSERWRHGSLEGINSQRQHQTCRGLSYYSLPDAAQATVCAQRVYMATADARLIALDARTGAELWRDRLPAGGQATPMTYLGADGRQYLIVVAGGQGSTGTAAGDSVIAYALPEG